MSFEVINRDCLEVMPQLIARGVTFPLVHADPPYGENQAEWDGERPPDELWDALYQVTAPGGVLYYWGFWRHAEWILSNARRVGYTAQSRIDWWFRTGRPQKHTFREDVEDCYYFSKGEPRTFNAHEILEPYEDESNYDRYGREGKHPGRVWIASRVLHNHPENVGHETQKPVELMRKIVRVSSNPGDDVFDPYAGSASMGAACAELRRNYLGVEKDEYKATVGRARVARASGLPCDIPRRVVADKPLPLFGAA